MRSVLLIQCSYNFYCGVWSHWVTWHKAIEIINPRFFTKHEYKREEAIKPRRRGASYLPVPAGGFVRSWLFRVISNNLLSSGSLWNMLPFRRDVTRHVTDFTSPATSTGGTCWSTCCPGSLRRAPCSGSRGLIWKWKKRKGHHFKICFDPVSALKMISLSPSRPDFLCFSHMISGCSLATSVGYKRSVWWIFF